MRGIAFINWERVSRGQPAREIRMIKNEFPRLYAPVDVHPFTLDYSDWISASFIARS